MPRRALRPSVLGLALLSLAAGCAGPDSSTPGQGKSPAVERAARRAYDGAPPVIPHRPFGASCVSCHNETGLRVEGVGYAPPSPHQRTVGMSDRSRCQQCHVFRRTDQVWVANEFDGLAQDLGSGRRAHPLAPPVIPHQVLMRENCLACHAGPAAREEIRTDHPERARCRQCHVPQQDTASRPALSALTR